MHSGFAGDRSREYKKNKAFIIDGIDYSRVIATRAYNASFKNTFREFLRFLAFDYDFSFKENSGKILVVYSYLGKGRADFDSIVDMFCHTLKYNYDRLDFIYKIRIVYIIKKLVHMVWLYFKFLFSKVRNPFFAAILSSQFIHYKGKLEKYLKNNNYELLVSFCDAHGIENMITQIAKEKGIKTATLQHGQYRVLKRETENADIESYDNFISDYLLAWGERTTEEFVKAGVDESRILPVGALKSFSKNERIPLHDGLNIFGVVLDGNIYHDSNVLMIKYANYLAKKFNLKYILRLHPKNNLNDYINLCDSDCLLKSISRIENSEYAKMVDFSIVHMTGVFVELLSINSPMILMKDDYLEDIFAIKGMFFRNEDEMDVVYNSFKSNPKEYTEEQYKLYRKFNSGGNLEENYQSAIDTILGDKK